MAAKRAASESSDSYSDSLSGSSSGDESPVRERAVSGKDGGRRTVAADPLSHEGLEAAPGVPKGRPVSDSEEEARVEKVRVAEKEGQESAERKLAPVAAAAKRRAESPVSGDEPEGRLNRADAPPSKKQRLADSDLEDEARFEKEKGRGALSKRPLDKSESDDDTQRKKVKPSAEARPAKAAAEKGDELLKKVTKAAPKAGRGGKRHSDSESDFSDSGTGSSFTGSSYSDSGSDSEPEVRPKKTLRK